MKTRKLRLVSALLAVAMMLALLPTAAFAADGELPTSGTCGAKGNEKNVYWTLDSDGTMTISGTGKMADYGKDPKTHIIHNPPWENYKGDIKHLVVENGVTSIGDDAFRNCTNLKNVDLSKASSLEVIKTSFPGCTGLENVVLNEGLVEIGGSAFNNCKSLGSIHIPSTVTAIGGYCFESCTSLSEVTFADGIQLTTIAEATFAGCKILETITIPKKVKGIQDSAFNGCRGLKSVTFEPGSELETIGLEAFQDTAISEISIPASVKTIGRYAFNECLNLTKVIFESPSKLDTVDENAFKGCSATIYYSDETAKNALISGKVDADRIKPLTPTVTFDFDNGTEAENKQVKNGEKVTPPTVPTKEDYIFAGWYTKDESDKWADKPFDFINTPIMDNMILYARWGVEATPITPATRLYPITIDYGTAYDAEGNPITKAAAGDVVTIKADETALEGMTFERWEVRKGEVKLENDRAAKTSFTMPAGEVQLEAMYQAADVHDSGWDAATVVTGAVIGTGTAILAYHIGMEVYAEQVLGKDVAVPRTRAEVALLAWQLAGSPAVNGEGESLSEAAQAEKWAVESGLMQPDAEGNFNGTKKMSKWNALRVLDAAKKQG